MKKNQRKKAFTLIELLVVIAIIGILTSLGIASYTVAQRKSRDAKRKADLETVRQGLILYRQDNGDYGPTASGQEGFASKMTELYDGNYLTSSSIVDPKNNEVYYYSIECTLVSGTDCNQFTLEASLENDDPANPGAYAIRTP